VDEHPPSPLDMTSMEGTCPQTVAGWLWYCDEHDTHGNADSEDEAEHVAAAHVEFIVDAGEEPCDVLVWQRTPHERAGG
jgi:hypothetical protein